MSNRVSNPYFFASARIASSPSATASWAIGMLQLRRSAVASVTWSPEPQALPSKLWIVVEVPGST